MNFFFRQKRFKCKERRCIKCDDIVNKVNGVVETTTFVAVKESVKTTKVVTHGDEIHGNRDFAVEGNNVRSMGKVVKGFSVEDLYRRYRRISSVLLQELSDGLGDAVCLTRFDMVPPTVRHVQLSVCPSSTASTRLHPSIAVKKPAETNTDREKLSSTEMSTLCECRAIVDRYIGRQRQERRYGAGTGRAGGAAVQWRR